MREVFLKVIDINVIGSYLILAVLLARYLLKKAPRSMVCFLWLLVGIRFLIPFSVESAFGLIPAKEAVRESTLYTDLPVIDTGIVTLDRQVNEYLIRNYDFAEEAEKIQPVTVICSYVWFAGMILMLLYYFYSWYRLKKKVSTSFPEVVEGEKVYRSEAVSSPFLMGVITPRIYLPVLLDAKTIPYVIAHEKVHRRRRDYLIKPAACLLLIIHWFNPLLWISGILLFRDIEYACDEQVVREFSKEQKKEYSTALLSCCGERKKPNLCPVAFGETDVKKRILRVLKYRKPAVWISAAAGIICLLVALCFMTQKKSPAPDGSVIEYDGYRFTLEDAVVCEETEGIIFHYRISSDTGNEKELEEFGKGVWSGFSGSTGNGMNENGDYEFSGYGFYAGEEGKRNLQNALTLYTRDGMEIGSFDPSLATKEKAEDFIFDSGFGTVNVTVSPHFMKAVFEDRIPDKRQRLLVMNMKQGERWKVTRVPMEVSGKQDIDIFDREVSIRSGAQDNTKNRIFLVFDEPVPVNDIESFSIILYNEGK